MKKIINIMRIRNVFIYDERTKKKTISFKGILLIEYEDYKRRILDLKTMKDITDDKNLKVSVRKHISIAKYIFGK